jgi:hypothetical protein
MVKEAPPCFSPNESGKKMLALAVGETMQLYNDDLPSDAPPPKESAQLGVMGKVFDLVPNALGIKVTRLK